MALDLDVNDQPTIGPHEIKGRWLGFAAGIGFNAVTDFAIIASLTTKRNLRAAAQFTHRLQDTVLNHGIHHQSLDKLLNTASKSLYYVSTHRIVSESHAYPVTLGLLLVTGLTVLASVKLHKSVPAEGKNAVDHPSYYIPSGLGATSYFWAWPGTYFLPGSIYTLAASNLVIAAGLSSIGGSLGRRIDNRAPKEATRLGL